MSKNKLRYCAPGEWKRKGKPGGYYFEGFCAIVFDGTTTPVALVAPSLEGLRSAWQLNSPDLPIDESIIQSVEIHPQPKNLPHEFKPFTTRDGSQACSVCRFPETHHSHQGSK